MYMHPDDLTSFSSPSRQAALPVTLVFEAVPEIVVGIGTTVAAPNDGRKLTTSPSTMMKSDISRPRHRPTRSLAAHRGVGNGASGIPVMVSPLHRLYVAGIDCGSAR